MEQVAFAYTATTITTHRCSTNVARCGSRSHGPRGTANGSSPNSHTSHAYLTQSFAHSCASTSSSPTSTWPPPSSHTPVSRSPTPPKPSNTSNASSASACCIRDKTSPSTPPLIPATHSSPSPTIQPASPPPI